MSTTMEFDGPTEHAKQRNAMAWQLYVSGMASDDPLSLELAFALADNFLVEVGQRNRGKP